MSKKVWIGLVVLVGAGAGAYTLLPKGAELPLVDVSDKQLADHYDAPAGLCPWRNSEEERKQWFPQSTLHTEELLSLSRKRLEVEKGLGRRPTGEDLGLPIHRILQGKTRIGTVIARRVRGESGVIEVALALDTTGTLKAWKVQRIREPEPITNYLRSEAFQKVFLGQNGAKWQEVTLPNPPKEAQASAKAVQEVIRATLILYAIAEPNAAKPPSK
jgi:hypothetical protein